MPRIAAIAMDIVDIHEAKTHLSRLVGRAVNGKPFMTAKTGKRLVMVTALDTPAAPRRLGFLTPEIAVPDDFDTMGAARIAT